MIKTVHQSGMYSSEPPSHSFQNRGSTSLKNYNRSSFLLIVDEDEEHLKFLKMHLNRTFSHVLAANSLGAGASILAEKPIDVIILGTGPLEKKTKTWLNKVAQTSRNIPIIFLPKIFLENSECSHPQLVVSGMLQKPVNLERLHSLLQISLSIRPELIEIDNLLGKKELFGEVIQRSAVVPGTSEMQKKIQKVRAKLNQQDVD